jgi:hypothetical protein
MDFKRISIPYAGREKYPSNGTGASIRSMITNLFGGSGAGGGIPGGGGDNRGGNASASFCFLSKTSGVYSAIDLAQSSITDNIQVMGYKNNDQAQTFIGDISQASPTTNYGILGVPASGMSILVSNNGTTGTTIILTIDSTISEDSGTLTIPVAINLSDNNLDPYHEVWYQNSNNCNVLYLQFSWTINRAATGNYTMDLSNQTAGVNCDTAGTLYSNSIATLQCTATTYYNGAIATGITYSARTQAAYAATGYSINVNTGAMSFTSAGTGQFYWAPAYPSLPIDIIAIKDGQPIATKTMTISRNYPGTDGTPAHTRYILTDADFIVYDPNTSAFTPTQVTGQVWLQVGNELPVRDNSTTIYQWFDDLEQYKTSAQGSITANATIGINSISFALKNGDGDYYEIEDVPVIPKGKDGEPGNPGDPGASGESAWYLTLSNDNASINCDSDGNILPNAVRPTCQAKLYHGSTRQTSGITYNVDYGGASGITSGVSNGILTLTFGSAFDFTGTSVAVSVSATTEGELRDVKTMNISKSFAGENGDDAITYWLETNFDEVIYDQNTKTPNPTSITAAAYKQIGQQAVAPAGDVTIKYRWQSRSTGSWTSESTYSSGVNITSGNCVSYARLRFTAYVGSNQVDQEDVDILMNGLDGTSGQARRGAAIRGPYLWDNVTGSTRCWCAGETGSTCSDCDKWIDVILKDGTYYYCNTTYNGRVYPWNSYSQYWTSGDTFDFVAANLILASGASIDFLTNNELYLRDSNGDITAGAAGGNGVNFWAGSDAPGDAPFQVNNDGTMTATKGTFGPFTIGTDSAGESSLTGTESDSYGTYETYINPVTIYFKGESSGQTSDYKETVSIAPNRNPDKYDGNGTIEVTIENQEYNSACGDLMGADQQEHNAFYTNGNVRAHRFLGDTRSHQINNWGGQAVMCPLLGTEITFMTSSSSNFAKYGTWRINGVDTTISAAEPQSLFTRTGNVWFFDGKPLAVYGVCIPSSSSYSFSTGGTQNWHFNGNDLGQATSNYSYVGVRTSSSSFGEDSDIGYWMVYNSGGAALNTGIAHPSYITKRNNVIYIEI